MSDMSYDRCPSDDWKAGFATIGTNPENGKPIELNINGVSSVIAMQSAFMTMSAAMKAGHEDDFLEKVALCLYGKLKDDPHALCPILSICSMILMMLNEQAGVVFKDGKVRIQPPDIDMSGGDTCMYDLDEEEEDNDEQDEETLGDADGGGFNPT